MSIPLKINDISDGVQRMQQWLNILDAPITWPSDKIYQPGLLSTDRHFGRKTEEALRAFQRRSGLTADGVFGNMTFTAMRDQVRRRLSGLSKLNFVRVPADKCGSGFTALRLRADVVPAYLELKKALNQCGAVLGTAGGVRDLSDSGRKGTSLTSLHYAGIAFDLPTDAAAVNPELDAYVIEMATDGRWRVWARCVDPTAPDFPEKMTTIQNPYTYQAKYGTKKPVTGHFVNFTAMANAFGFNHIPPWSNWRRPGVSTMTWEWWHFQYELVLFPIYSRFGDEILSVYSEDFFKKYPNLYANRNAIWQMGWRG